MKHLYAAVRWLIVVGFIGIFSLSAGIAPVQAGVGCANVIPVTDGTANDLHNNVKLSGKSLVWAKSNGELFHYNTETEITTPIGTMYHEYSLYGIFAELLDVEDDRVAWIDPNNQVQLYTVSSATTIQVTNGSKLKTDVQIEGDYVLWRQGKEQYNLKKLFLYDIAAATTTKLAKTLVYSLNEGRALWAGNLYNLATGTTTFLGADHYTLLEGNHALGMYQTPAPNAPDQLVSQLGLKDLTTGVVTQITNTYFRTRIYEFTMQGDYITWIEQHGLNTDSTLDLYQISTGLNWDVLPNGESTYDEQIAINDRFLSYTDYVSQPGQVSHPGFFIYDLVSLTSNHIFFTPGTYSGFGAVDEGRIAWIEFKIDGGLSDMQVMLGTDCGGKPTLTSQTTSLNIITGRSVDLNVTVVGDQPMTYQWYQGEVGDTTTPVGDAGISFTTPPLTETTSYWFQATNHFGTAETETITLTPGATAELVVNGSFEEARGSFFADWTGYDLYQDCEGAAAHTGNCAARVDEYAAPGKLTQQLSLEFPYLTGDTLTLSAWIKANEIAFADAAVLLKVRYADDTKAKLVLKPTQTQFDYTQFTSEPLTITGVISKAKVIIKYQNEEGDWWLDDVSLLHQPASVAVLPLPSSGLSGTK